MVIELSQTNFKRLVWFYLATIFILVCAIVFQNFDPDYGDFVSKFDEIFAEHYGPYLEADSPIAIGVIALSGAALLWSITSVFAMLRFEPWGRFGFWASAIAFLPLTMVPNLAYPAVTTAIEEILLFVSQCLFGAIVIVSHAKGHGDVWFNQHKNLDR